jgi:hypothetical protein
MVNSNNPFKRIERRGGPGTDNVITKTPWLNYDRPQSKRSIRHCWQLFADAVL